MAYSIHIKGVRDEEDSKMIKLQLIFYKSGYNSPMTIYKHYYKNTKRDKLKIAMEEMF